MLIESILATGLDATGFDLARFDLARFDVARFDVLASEVSKLAQAAGSVFVSAIWQTALVAICLACALRLARRTTAALRFSIWVTGFLAAVCMPFWPILWSRLATHASISAASAASGHATPWIQVDLRWSVALALLWGTASLYRAIDLAVHAIRLRQLWKDATPVPEEKLTLLPAFEPLNDSRHPSRQIELCTTLKQDRPAVIGFFAPRILIPAWLLDRLSPAELAQIVLHETEHIRRGDDWTNLLQKLGLVLFPLNPALLWMDRRLCAEREMACDEAVVRATRAPRAYAACLTTLAEHGRAWRNQAMERAALTLGAWRRRSELVSRVHSILRFRNGSPLDLSKLHSRGILATLACGLMVGSAELGRCPQLIGFAPEPTESVTSAQVRPEQNEHSALVQSAVMAQPVSTRNMAPVHIKNLNAVVPPRSAASYISYDDIPATKAKASWSVTPATLRQPVRKQPRVANPYENAIALNGTDGQQMAQLDSNASDQEGWLVLTTWEEVATNDTAGMANPSANYPATGPQAGSDQSGPDQAASVDAAPGTASLPQAEPQAAQQIRVTRVIFRVVPASFVSPAPHVARTRDGWLVLQL